VTAAGCLGKNKLIHTLICAILLVSFLSLLKIHGSKNKINGSDYCMTRCAAVENST
jgi:hypothetical protein